MGILAGIDEFSASSRMNHYEQGKHFPDFEMMKRIAKILDVPVGYFYITNEESANMLARFERLSAPKKKKLLAFLDELDPTSISLD